MEKKASKMKTRTWQKKKHENKWQNGDRISQYWSETAYEYIESGNLLFTTHLQDYCQKRE